MLEEDQEGLPPAWNNDGVGKPKKATPEFSKPRYQDSLSQIEHRWSQ